MRVVSPPREHSPVVTVTALSVEEAIKCYAQQQALAIQAESCGEKEPVVFAMRREAARRYEAHIHSIYEAEGDFGVKASYLDDIELGRRGAGIDIRAANSLGTLVGNMVGQESLLLLRKRMRNIFKNTSTDFSSAQVKINQTFFTRTRSIPTVNYWTPGVSSSITQSNAVTADVAVTPTQIAYVSLNFDYSALTETSRDLIGEQVEPASYALEVAMFQSWINLFTDANYDKTALLGRKGYVQAINGFNRLSLIGLNQDMNTLTAPEIMRVCVLSSLYYSQLLEDPSLVSWLYTAPSRALRITGSDASTRSRSTGRKRSTALRAMSPASSRRPMRASWSIACRLTQRKPSGRARRALPCSTP